MFPDAFKHSLSEVFLRGDFTVMDALGLQTTNEKSDTKGIYNATNDLSRSLNVLFVKEL